MRFTPATRRNTLLRADLTAMIDIIFQLLIFFLLSTTYAPPEGHLEPALRAEHQEAGAAADLVPQLLEVQRRGDQTIFIVGQVEVRDEDSLVALLASLPKQGGLFVRAQDTATVEGAIAALQAARDAQFEKVTYVPPAQ